MPDVISDTNGKLCVGSYHMWRLLSNPDNYSFISAVGRDITKDVSFPMHMIQVKLQVSNGAIVVPEHTNVRVSNLHRVRCAMCATAAHTHRVSNSMVICFENRKQAICFQESFAKHHIANPPVFAQKEDLVHFSLLCHWFIIT